jgi:hypothetical protein
MARDKVTVTLDRQKAQAAMELSGGRSVSAVIDLALDQLIHAERLRHDIAAYALQPLTEDELLLATLPVRLDLGDEDVDYDALYGTTP